MVPEIGDFFVARTDGPIGRIIRYMTGSEVNHAGIYIGDNTVVETRPGGVRYGKFSEYVDATWSTGRLPEHLTPTLVQRRTIVSYAQSSIGIPYGILDILTIAFAQQKLGHRIKFDKPLNEQPWLVRRRNTTKTKVICSEFVDLLYKEAGIQLFSDGRLESLVSPHDLLGLLVVER